MAFRESARELRLRLNESARENLGNWTTRDIDEGLAKLFGVGTIFGSLILANNSPSQEYLQSSIVTTGAVAGAVLSTF